MRDHHHGTVQKDHENINRKLKWSSNEHSRTPKKIVRKSLDPLLTTVSEDVSLKSANDLNDTSSICEVLDEDQLEESSESSMNSFGAGAAISPSVASTPSDLSGLNSTICSDSSSITGNFSPLLTAITSNKVRTNKVKVNHNSTSATYSAEIVKGELLTAEIFAKKFRQARTQNLKANDMIVLSENVMKVLLRAVIGDLHDLPEKRDRFTALVEKKVYIVLKKVFSVILTLMLLIIVVGVLVSRVGDGGSYHELLPT